MRSAPQTSRSSGQPGSQSALRRLNEHRILETLSAGGPCTQAELARRTGLSTATVSNIVKALADAGRVEANPTTSGRRASTVRLSSGRSLAVGFDFGRRHLRVVLASGGYVVVDERFIELPLGHGAEDGIVMAGEILAEMLHLHGLSSSDVVGVGVGIPGPIDRRTGTVVQGTILPEWVGIDLRGLEERIHYRVLFDNDANLGALAEVTWGLHRSVDDLVFVKVGTGIGAGLILGGSPYYGTFGVTGEIGHATINDHGVVCHCGNRGCLETVASTATMIDLLSRGGPRVAIADILERAATGDSATLRVLDDAGAAIGRALAGVANLVNPAVIVIGGPLTALGDVLLRPIARGLVRHAVPSIGDSTRLVMSSLGERAEVLGAAAIVIQRYGAPMP